MRAAFLIGLLSLTAGCESGAGHSWIGITPGANPDMYVVDTNKSLVTLASTGVLANDTDVGNAVAELVDPPSAGTLVLENDGAFTFVPPMDFFGTVTFSYRAVGARRSATVTVTISVQRWFVISTDVPAIDLVQGTSATLGVSIQATDAASPPISVAVTLENLPTAVTASPLTLSAGNSGVITIASTSGTPQSARRVVSVTGTAPARTISSVITFEVRGAAGTPDKTFGDGTIRIDLGSIGDEAHNVAFAPDGNIIVGGVTRLPSGSSTSFAIAAFRLHDDGTPDLSFGSNGIAIHQVGGGYSYESAMALLADGKILVAGEAVSTSSPYLAKALLLRLNANGSIDNSFGGGAPVEKDVGALFGSPGTMNSYPRALAVHPSGSILWTGSMSSSTGPSSSAWVGEYSANGTPISSYGTTGGFRRFDFGGSNSTAWDGAVDHQGRFVVTGADAGNSSVARFDESGGFDTSFAGTGTSSVPQARGPLSLAVTSNDGIAFGGVINGQGLDLSAVLADPAGNFSAAFTSAAGLSLSLPDDQGSIDILVDGQQRLLVVGGIHEGSRYGIFAARLLADGSLDLSLNGGLGYCTLFDNDPNRNLFAASAGIDLDGRLVIAGTTQPAGIYDDDAFVARLWL